MSSSSFPNWGFSLPNVRVGVHVIPDDPSFVEPLLNKYSRPWRHHASTTKDIGSSVKVDADKIEFSLDVKHFAPEEISVKTADGYIIVECKHEEKKDEHGFISRQFSRRYPLPKGSLPETLESKLSSDGVLTITAPLTVPESMKGERNVPITQTGPVRTNIKDQKEGTSEDKITK